MTGADAGHVSCLSTAFTALSLAKTQVLVVLGHGIAGVARSIERVGPPGWHLCVALSAEMSFWERPDVASASYKAELGGRVVHRLSVLPKPNDLNVETDGRSLSPRQGHEIACTEAYFSAIMAVMTAYQ